MFNNRKPKVREMQATLTKAQKNKITDLFSSGNNVVAIKHAMYEDFEPGKAFHHLIEEAIGKIKRIEASCATKMMVGVDEKEVPKDSVALKVEIAKEYTDCDADCLGHLLSKIVAATGTWKEYAESFQVNPGVITPNLAEPAEPVEPK